MEASGSHLFQLAAAILSAVGLFVAAISLREKYTLTLLVLLLPFQFITSRYGSMNVMLIYLVSAAFFMRGFINLRPLMLPFVAILLASLISMGLAPRATWFDHGTYLIGFGSNILAFLIFYSYVQREEEWGPIWKMLIGLNILVIAYCGLQLTIGLDRFSIFGISELSIIGNRTDQRLVGPFEATAATAEYLVIQVLLLAYAFLNSQRSSAKAFYSGLIAANCFFLVTTGNRGGVIALAIGMLGFLYLFRREIGILRSFAVLAMIGTIFTVTAVVAVQYTQFNRLFERIQETQVEGWIPDTRERAWPIVWEAISDKPVFGHGPRLRLIDEMNRRIPNHTPIGYPHSAYLFILYTIGYVGLAAYIILVIAILRKLMRAASNAHEQPIIHGLPRMGLLLLFVVLISQIRIEMFRFGLFDYQNIIFVFFGIFVGFADTLHGKYPVKLDTSKNRVRRPLSPSLATSGSSHSQS